MYRHVKGGCTGWSREAVNNFEATFVLSRAAALWPQITNWDIFRISTEPTSFRILNYFHSRWWQTPRFCNNVRICGFLSLESFEAGNLHALWHQRLLSNISRPDWKESILKIPRSISPQLVSTLELASGDCQPFTLTLVLRWSFVRGEDSTLEWRFDKCVQKSSLCGFGFSTRAGEKQVGPKLTSVLSFDQISVQGWTRWHIWGAAGGTV